MPPDLTKPLYKERWGGNVNHRTKEFIEDLYWIAFAVVLVLLAVTLVQFANTL